MRFRGTSSKPLRSTSDWNRYLLENSTRNPARSSRQLRDEISDRSFPAARSGRPREGDPEAPRHNLPAARTSFVGREREIVEIKRELAATRLLTLTGAGGSGKTRLALEIRRDLAGAYPGGVWLAELAPLSENTLVPQAVATALGVQERAGQSLTETLVEVLDSVGTRSSCWTTASTSWTSGRLPGRRAARLVREPAHPGHPAARPWECLGRSGGTCQPYRHLTCGVLLPWAILEICESVRLFAERARHRDS